MKEIIRIIILIALIMTGSLLQSCKTLDGDYKAEVHNVDSLITDFEFQFIEQSEIAYFSYKISGHPLRDRYTYERVGTMAYDLITQDTVIRINYWDGQWQMEMKDSVLVFLTPIEEYNESFRNSLR